MANDFKAAAERKKKMTEGRKAQRLIAQVEELLNEQNEDLSPEEISGLQARAGVLKELTADASASVDVMMVANEEAQMLLDAIAEKRTKAQAEEPASEKPVAEEPASEEPAEEKVEEPVVVPEEVQQEPSAPEEEVPTETETAPVVPEEPAQANDKPATENYEFDVEGISEVLLQMYKAPRYSRLKGETKKRFSALIKPSLIDKMREDQAAGRITSPNDLINGLLEIFYGED